MNLQGPRLCHADQVQSLYFLLENQRYSLHLDAVVVLGMNDGTGKMVAEVETRWVAVAVAEVAEH